MRDVRKKDDTDRNYWGFIGSNEGISPMHDGKKRTELKTIPTHTYGRGIKKNQD